MKSRLSWSDLQHLREIILVLATAEYEKVLEKLDQKKAENEIPDTHIVNKNTFNAVDRLVEAYKVPLQGAGAEVDKIRIEFEAMMAYSVQFISLPTLHYKRVYLFINFSC